MRIKILSEVTEVHRPDTAAKSAQEPAKTATLNDHRHLVRNVGIAVTALLLAAAGTYSLVGERSGPDVLRKELPPAPSSVAAQAATTPSATQPDAANPTSAAQQVYADLQDSPLKGISVPSTGNVVISMGIGDKVPIGPFVVQLIGIGQQNTMNSAANFGVYFSGNIVGIAIITAGRSHTFEADVKVGNTAYISICGVTIMPISNNSVPVGLTYETYEAGTPEPWLHQ